MYIYLPYPQYLVQSWYRYPYCMSSFRGLVSSFKVIWTIAFRPCLLQISIANGFSFCKRIQPHPIPKMLIAYHMLAIHECIQDVYRQTFQCTHISKSTNSPVEVGSRRKSMTKCFELDRNVVPVCLLFLSSYST